MQPTRIRDTQDYPGRSVSIMDDNYDFEEAGESILQQKR